MQRLTSWLWWSLHSSLVKHCPATLIFVPEILERNCRVNQLFFDTTLQLFVLINQSRQFLFLELILTFKSVNDQPIQLVLSLKTIMQKDYVSDAKEQTQANNQLSLLPKMIPFTPSDEICLLLFLLGCNLKHSFCIEINTLFTFPFFFVFPN